MKLATHDLAGILPFLLDACEDCAGLIAEVDHELHEFFRSVNVLHRRETPTPQFGMRSCHPRESSISTGDRII